MGEWREVRLGDICTLNYGKSLTSNNRKAGNIPVYSSAGITGWHNESLVNNKGIIVGRKGTVGTVYYSESPFYCIDTAYYVLPQDNKYDFKYLFYRLGSLGLKNLNEDSAVPGLNRETAYSQTFMLPPLPEQKTIAETLSCLDDKIELNNKINANLEQTAQAIFKSWFVDFEPFQDGEFVKSELGRIPKGWRVGTLGDVTTEIRDKVKNQNLKVFSAVKTGELQLSEEYFTKQVFSKDIGKYIIVEPLDFAYNPARINIGSIGMNEFGFSGCVSPVYVVFKTEPKYHNFFNLYIKNQPFKQEVIVRASGSVRQTMNYCDLSLIKIVYPPVEVVEDFNQIYEALKNNLRFNQKENDSLIAIRDSLLPKLMSGEIDVTQETIPPPLRWSPSL